LVDKVINPSLVAVPLAVKRLFKPLTVVGIGIELPVGLPAIVYSSRKTAVALLLKGALPAPTR
jgi:hypothetical protein